MTQRAQQKRLSWTLAGGLTLVCAIATPGIVSAQDRAAVQTYWYDGNVRREIWIDPHDQSVRNAPGQQSGSAATRGAAPSKGGAPGNPVVLPGPAGSGGSAANAGTAPQTTQRKGGPASQTGVVSTASAPATVLAAGVIVTLRQPLPDAQARALLKSQGLTAQREVGAQSGVWLIDAPAGLDSLQLANRLHESGVFASAQPNWQRPVLTK